VYFGAMSWSFLIHWQNTGDIAALILLTSEGSVVLFVLIRRFTADVSMRPMDWFVALLGTMVPLLGRPTGGDPLAPALVYVSLMLVGVVIQIGAKFSLRRSFGMVAANRGVKVGGPYRIVRHPMYAGYILTQIGFFLSNPSYWNAMVYGTALALQISRILAEERVLSVDPAYRDFAVAVPYRLAPRIF
jgi:protein-S-isoprenylcysteine O-methyltransferase Ste14